MKKRVLSIFLYASLLYADMTTLVFKGNKNLSDSELYGALSLEQPLFYELWKDPPAVEIKTMPLLTQSIQNYYKAKGFYHTEVSFKEEKTKVVMHISENNPIIIASMTTISKLPIDSVLPFKIGDIFDAQKFSQSKKDIKLIYGNKSYCNMELDAKAWVDIESDKAYIAYEVTPYKPCHVGALTIASTQNIESDIIASLLYVKENEPFSTENIAKSYENLYGYEGISKVIINTSVENNSSVSVNVDVKENEKPMRFEGGLGFSSEEGPMVSLGLKHRNIFGNLKTATLESKLTGIEQSIKTTFDVPFARGSSIGGEFGYQNEIFDGFNESHTFSHLYIKERQTPYSVKGSLVFDYSTTYDSEDLDSFPEGSLFITSPKFEWGFDSRDKILNPTSGAFFMVDALGSVLSSLSDASYYKVKLTGGYIAPLGDATLGVRASLGTLNLIEGEIPASYRFYAGGMNSNRAYSYNTLGPQNSDGDPEGFDSIVEATLEYRFPVYGQFKGVVFNDNTFIGNDDRLNSLESYHSLGFGVRYVTPIGPLAVDLGFDIEDPTANYALHFRIGELF